MKKYYYKQNITRKISFEDGRVAYLLMQHSYKLYNRAMNIKKEDYKNKRKAKTWVQMRDYLVDDVNFKILGEALATSTIRNMFINYANFFKNLEKSATYREPSFRGKESSFFLAFYGIKITNKNTINLPLSKLFREKYLIEDSYKLKIVVAKNFIDMNKKISCVRLQKHQDNRFYVVYEYQDKAIEFEKKEKNKVGIDLGVDNLISAYSTKGENFILKGKFLKFVNYKYLRLISDEKDIEKKKNLTIKRNNIINNYFKRCRKYLERYIIKNNISSLVVGDFKYIKKTVRARNFYYIPFRLLIVMLRDLCDKLDVEYILTEESYTSKTSFFDEEKIGKNEERTGSRVKRGLFKTIDGHRINADINGAANILRKKYNSIALQNKEKILINPKILK